MGIFLTLPCRVCLNDLPVQGSTEITRVLEIQFFVRIMPNACDPVREPSYGPWGGILVTRKLNVTELEQGSFRFVTCCPVKAPDIRLASPNHH